VRRLEALRGASCQTANGRTKIVREPSLGAGDALGLGMDIALREYSNLFGSIKPILGIGQQVGGHARPSPAATARRPAPQRREIAAFCQKHPEVILENVEGAGERVRSAFGLARIAPIAGRHLNALALARNNASPEPPADYSASRRTMAWAPELRPRSTEIHLLLDRLTVLAQPIARRDATVPHSGRESSADAVLSEFVAQT
jgi:hypothetical protein